mmetsp:Transcript_79383/g.192144  ORF Transcript_79383/g.192144 Transcript_79383/m.192144 type:complete len:260 (-) Transcript_79383:362-1141(-)
MYALNSTSVIWPSSFSSMSSMICCAAASSMPEPSMASMSSFMSTEPLPFSSTWLKISSRSATEHMSGSCLLDVFFRFLTTVSSVKERRLRPCGLTSTWPVLVALELVCLPASSATRPVASSGSDWKCMFRWANLACFALFFLYGRKAAAEVMSNSRPPSRLTRSRSGALLRIVWRCFCSATETRTLVRLDSAVCCVRSLPSRLTAIVRVAAESSGDTPISATRACSSSILSTTLLNHCASSAATSPVELVCRSVEARSW